jgi:paraquat-inducible protein B
MVDPVELGDVPEARPAPRRRGLSITQAIWIIPLLAIGVVGWLVTSEWLQRGPTITLHFGSGEGIEAGKTRIKYRNVDVGEVSSVRLSSDRKGVLVSAEMSRDAAPLLVEDTRFWVVRPRVSGSEISGLATLLSGSFIGMDAGQSGTARRDFVGLDQQPVVSADEPGREFVLQGGSLGSLDIGSSVFFHGMRVGQVLSTDLRPDGRGVQLRAFIRAPYDRFVTGNTRFWHASGLDVTVDSNGLRLRTESIVSVLVGGVAFETPPGANDQEPAAADTVFRLFDSQTQAVHRSPSQMVEHVATFTDSVRGLGVGAQVEFKGFAIGEVAAIDIAFDTQRRRFVFPVRLAIYKDIEASIRNPQTATGEQPRRFEIERLLSRESFERGLRAQLRTGNLLTGQRYVAIDFFPEHRDDELTAAVEAGREIPTVPDAFGEIQASISRIVKKLENVPLEELAGDVRRTLSTVDSAVKSIERAMSGLDRELIPSATKTLDEARAAARDVRSLVAQDAPATQELRGALRDLSRAADAIRQLADTLERQPEALLRGRRPAPAAKEGAQ